MRYLLDTNVWLWLARDPSRIGSGAVELLSDPASTLMLSAASPWEAGIKAALGKLHLGQDISSFVQATIRAQRLTVLSVVWPVAVKVTELPHIHGDPFDRLLIAQARAEGVPIVTSDRMIARYDVEVIDPTI